VPLSDAPTGFTAVRGHLDASGALQVPVQTPTIHPDTTRRVEPGPIEVARWLMGRLYGIYTDTY